MTPDGCSDHRSQLTQCTTYPNGITQSTRFLCYITVRQQGDCRHYIQPCLLSTNIVTTRMLIKIVSLLNVKRCDRKLDTCRCLPVSNDVAIAYHGPWSRGAAWAPASSYPIIHASKAPLKIQAQSISLFWSTALTQMVVRRAIQRISKNSFLRVRGGRVADKTGLAWV